MAGAIAHTSPTMIMATVAPTGHSPERLCAPDMATIPAQVTPRNVQTMSKVATTNDR